MNKLCLLLSSLLLLGQSSVWAAAPATLPGVDFADTPEWALTGTQYGGKLLLSDSPETVSADGIMYQDKVDGDVRLFFHHVNGTDKLKKFFALISNQGSTEAKVSVYRHGFAGPGSNYGEIGKAAQQDYFANSRAAYDVTIPAGKQDFLWDAQKSMIVKPGDLVNGIFDFKISQPVTIKMVMVPDHYNDQTLAQLKVLDPDRDALRGTFAGRDKLLVPYALYNPQQDGVVAITLADNVVDPYIIGTDTTNGHPVMNYGDYGVMYHLFIPSTDGHANFKSYLNPRGGDYGGALGVKYDHQLLDPVLTPREPGIFGTNTIEAVSQIGSYQSGKSLWLTFSPPGASNLPVKIMLVPDPLPTSGPGIVKNGLQTIDDKTKK